MTTGVVHEGKPRLPAGAVKVRRVSQGVRRARAIALVVSLAALASAPVARAASLDFAELRIRIRTDPLLVPVGTMTLPSLNPAGIAPSNTYATLAAGNAFSGWDILQQMTPDNSVALFVRENETGVFAGPPMAGLAPFTGTASISRETGPSGRVLSFLPIAFGGASTTIITGISATAGVPFLALRYQERFRTGVVTVGGTAGIPLIGTGFNSLTESGEGTLVLVAPMQIVAPGRIDIDALAELELHYVPEPGTSALLIWGAAALGWRARELARRQARSEGR